MGVGALVGRMHYAIADRPRIRCIGRSLVHNNRSDDSGAFLVELLLHVPVAQLESPGLTLRPHLDMRPSVVSSELYC